MTTKRPTLDTTEETLHVEMKTCESCNGQAVDKYDHACGDCDGTGRVEA